MGSSPGLRPLIGADLSDLTDDWTRLVWIESPGFGILEVQDVAAIVAAARARGVLLDRDNIWATPRLFGSPAHGADFAAEVPIKKGGGRSDLLLGSVTATDLHRQPRRLARLIQPGIGRPVR